ncbi:MAG: hypothetical protein ACLF0P_08650 [Thermoanaerobaculia bacterium]
MADALSNCIAEWFGHRTYPTVQPAAEARKDQESKRCPFLSAATGETRPCIKATSSLGVCTISSISNGPRQDWLVCPYRGLDKGLLRDVVQRLFGDAPGERLIVPVPNLAKEEFREEVVRECESGGRPIVYLTDKLGGEISISRTDRSPELSFDMTMAELSGGAAGLRVLRYGIFELQTMDFHGSYRHAVKNLEDALRLHGEGFHHALEENPRWMGDRIEGPNIANVFKRTFYQMMLKFQIGKHSQCSGTALALPEAVWDSWQRHLGGPELVSAGEDFELRHPQAAPFGRDAPAWIYVFDVDAEASESPSPLLVKKRIGTDAEAVSHFALQVAPDAAVGPQGTASLIPDRIKQRIVRWWPEVLFG